MANDENTAVNDLIARVGGGPLQPAVQKSSVQMPSVGNETIPASPRAMAFGSAPSAAPQGLPLPAPAERRGLPEGVASGIPAWSFEAQRRIDDGEHLIGTLRVSHKSSTPHPLRRYVPMVLIAFGGILVGVVVALRAPSKSRSETGAPAAAQPAAVVAAASAAPVVTPASAAVVTPASAAVVTPAPAAVVTPAPAAVVTPAPAAVVTPAPAAVVTPAPAVVVTPAPAAVVTPAPTAVVTPAPAAVVTPAPAAVVTPAPAAVVTSAPSPAATVTPAAGPVAPPVTAAPAVAAAKPAAASALLDVRIDSLPAGATVMLVDRGKTQLVGNTPIAAAIDPTRDYDLVFTYAGKPTKIEHLDPRITQHITVALDGAAPVAPTPPPSPAPPPVATPRRQVEPARHEARPEPVRGEGTLMVSSKPPCEIVIDGKPTGLTTPQRAIALSAGRHKVTLVNGDKDIKRTFSVQISPNATEKLIQDLMR